MSPSSSFKSVPSRCLNVPVLYELLKGEEEHSRVWLRDEMNQIPDPLIDSIFHGLIMPFSSSSVVPYSSSTVSELCQQLQGEKVQLRWVLRCEMDRVVNTLFEKLTNKLMIDLDRSEDAGDREQFGNLLDQIESQSNPQSHQPSSHIAQPSTSSSFNHDFHQQHSNANEPEFDPILAEVKQEILDEENEMELENVMDNKATQISNEMLLDCVKQEVKEEFEDGEMLLIQEEEDENDVESRFAEIETIQFDPTGGQSQVIVAQSVKRKQPNEESNQVQNVMVNRENEEDNVQVEVEDDDAEEGTSRSVKRPRIPSRISTSSNSTEEKQIITHTLQCPQSGCELMFAKDQFATHLWDRHSIRPHRCLVKDCGHHSFDNHLILSEHLAQCHQSTSQWHCDKCLKHFSTYPSLSMHNINYHQIGHFQCSFPACTFTGEYKMKVYCHYIQQHKKTEFNCHHSECSYVAPNVPNLKQHLQSHLEPYQCKWTGCHFASGTRVTTLAHIRSVHLKKCAKTYSRASKQSPQIDPNDYLEVIQFK